eukprot:3927555-Amphidinium_carterae.1
MSCGTTLCKHTDSKRKGDTKLLTSSPHPRSIKPPLWVESTRGFCGFGAGRLERVVEGGRGTSLSW